MYYTDNERVSDPSDIATLFEMGATENAVQEVRAALAPEVHPDFDGENCVECGDPIPTQRLAMGRVRCTGCQGVIELRRKQYAH